MLKTKLIHPEILKSLATSGHTGMVLIADGNYPFATLANPNAKRVYLNLAPGKLTVTEVLEILLTTIPVEAAHAMRTADGTTPDIFEDFEDMLDVTIQKLDPQSFYDLAFDKNMALVIATGEQRLYGNIILTIGVVT